jgi:hypothetical protein
MIFEGLRADALYYVRERGKEISFFHQPLLKLLKVGLQLLQMGSAAPMKLIMELKNPFEVLIIPIFEMTLSIL